MSRTSGVPQRAVWRCGLSTSGMRSRQRRHEQMFALAPPARYLGRSRTDVRPREGPGGRPGWAPQGDADGRGPEREAAADPQLHRRLPARPGLSALGARDRRGGRAWPPRPPCTPTWPCSSARATCPGTRASPGPSRSTSTPTPTAKLPAAAGAQRAARGRRGGRDRRAGRGEHRGAAAHARAVHRERARRSCCGSAATP